MRAFQNVSREGNEKAIRRGRVVPKGDVNLAYIRAPELSPEENVVIVDTSRIIEENVRNTGQGCKLYFANALGVLVDENNNTVVADEFPAVTDVFSIDEDFSVEAGNEYTTDSILPYRHVSRYFHLDHAGLTITSEELDYKSEHIKVIDNRGVEYDNYRVRIVAAYLPTSTNTGDTWAYRVFVYIDDDSNEDLYLKYNKIELEEDGSLVNRDLNHQELLNPEPFFDYIPEESDVVDPDNRRAKIYSTKPLTFKDRILGKLDNGVDGYKVYVPKKAIGDPRIYQLFRWRIKCIFKQDVTIDPTTDISSVKCGVIVTNKDLSRTTPSRAAYAFYNLQRSSFNVNNVRFDNPHKDNHTLENKRKRSYWFVNIDTEDLSDYDFLIWAPPIASFDFGKYSAKIGDFISKVGGTVFIDTNAYTDAYNTLGGVISRPVNPKNGGVKWGSNPLSNPSQMAVRSHAYRLQNTSHALINGDAELGGWQLGAGTIDIPSYSQMQHRTNTLVHGFSSTPRGYTALIQGRDNASTSNFRNLVIAKSFKKGNKILSTMGVLQTCSYSISYIDGSTDRSNLGATSISTAGNYAQNINGAYVEGAMKLLYNAVLLAVRSKILDSSDETDFSTTWEYTTPWRSSWVINAEDGVLTDKEKSENDFFRDPKDVQGGELEPIWKRRLANKTYKQLVDEALKPIRDNPQTANRIDGSTRVYEIEVTNPFVETGSVLVENDYPWAYTEAPTPHFEVPVELGPHIIKEEVDEQGRRGRVAQYEDATYIKKDYPDLPYSGRVSITYANSEEFELDSTTSYTATGTAQATKKITTTTPPQTIVTSSNVELSWWDARVESAANPGAPLDPNGTAWDVHMGFPDFGMVKPNGIKIWQDANYKSNAWGPGNLCWPHWGMIVKLNTGSTGDAVKFVQDALNRFQGAQYFGTSSGILKVDGYYGAKTKQAVRDLQTTMQARYIDGVVDAESWFIIGAQINRLESNGLLGRVGNDYTGFFGWAKRMRLHQVSDGSSAAPSYAKRSWVSSGPSTIWELFSITFDKSYKWHGITVVPFVQGAARDMMVRSVHVTNERSLTNYDSTWGQMTYMSHRPSDGSALRIPFGPYNGDTLIVGVGQDKSSGWGTARTFGIRDIRGHTTITDINTIPGTTTITYQTESINFQKTGTIEVESFQDKVIQLEPPSWKGLGYHSVSNIRWNGITVTNPEVEASITSGGKATFTTSVIETAVTTGQVTRGPIFPDFSYYSMDETGKLNPVKETGYVSKAEGIKLLCTKDKKPVGFPAIPATVGANEAQRHYVKLSLSTKGTASDVTMSFYDFKEKEFITTVNGVAEMSYLEYIRRGPQNIYIAVVTDYELTNEEVIPVDEDAPRLPFKWAMPVYGVCSKRGSRITLEPLPPRLGPKDVWPIAVREGKFTRQSRIRSRSEGRLTGWLSGFQGMVLESFYSIPEAELGGYSTNFGPPNSDVINEEPLIVDDNVIQVRQAPILMVTHPTQYPNPADPFRPVFKFYKRTTINDPWVEQPMTEIADYNASTGEIFLKNNLNSNDESLLRVDYTTKRRSYYFKSYEDQILNLNSYSGHTRDLIGEAIYVYIVPHYVKDPNGEVIPASVNERTLRMTLSPSVFNPLDPAYDPLAIQLGIVYQSTALDIDKVAVIDTRRRGGGVADGIGMEQVQKAIGEATTYWDTGYATGSSYQKAGYVVVRLPRELQNDFTEEEIRDIITRNMTSSVAFKLEDLTGREWA